MYEAGDPFAEGPSAALSFTVLEDGPVNRIPSLVHGPVVFAQFVTQLVMVAEW